MTGGPTLFLSLLAFPGLLGLAAWLLLRRVRRAEALNARLRNLETAPGVARDTAARWRWTLPVIAVGGFLMRSGLLPRTTLHEAVMLLDRANLHGEMVLAIFVGSKVLLLAGLPALGWGLVRLAGNAGLMTGNFTGGHASLMAIVAGAAAALLLPDLLLSRRRRRRLAELESGLPDTLDLLVICVDAGLTFEQALERVTREITPVYPVLASEFAVTIGELAISPDRRAVLMDMGARLGVDFLRRLAATIAQSLQLGAPLSRALRQLAQELRQEHMLRIETRAARLPVLLTIPMVIFIMPAVLVVVCGPALIQVLRSF